MNSDLLMQGGSWEDAFMLDNTVLNVRINKSTDCQLIVVNFGFNLISYTIENWTIQRLILLRKVILNIVR